MESNQAERKVSEVRRRNGSRLSAWQIAR